MAIEAIAMIPTVLICNETAGQCWALNIERVEPSFAICEQRIEAVIEYASSIPKFSTLPGGFYVSKKECIYVYQAN